ncbi:hypothetical protein AcW1_003383 [Taiwanofungus camphoratus]|nr:hypothetical protein AcW1_003383 [Antrodia cinnamomea]
MSSASGQDISFENSSLSEPHSRRVGIAGPPSTFRLSTSTTESFESASSSPLPSSGHPSPSSPPRPPRSPLRPAFPARRASGPVATLLTSELVPSPDDMPLLHSRSFGSFSGLLDLQPSSSSLQPSTPRPSGPPPSSSQSSGSNLRRSARPPTPNKPLPITPDPSISSSPVEDDHDREGSLSQFASASASAGSPLLRTSPVITKRTHALLELLSSERAYASDLALIRDIHIPLALGQPAPYPAAHDTPPSSGSSASSSRTLSTASESSNGSATGPPMTREDTRIIFNNIAELAVFSDTFTEQLEEALGSVLEGGTGEDHVGALFLEMIPTLEPLYKSYITKHPSALEHLNNLPSSPALTAYLAHTRTLASNLSHAWDLPSLLIKPVQRLLKYSLLLSAIIDETPDAHSDKANLKLAKERMEEVARGVNEGRRRREVVKEVLTGTPSGTPSKKGSESKAKPKKKGLNVGVAASVSLGRVKSIGAKSYKAKEGIEANQEAEQVERMAEDMKRCETFIHSFAKDVVVWVDTVHRLMEQLRDWSVSFGRVIWISQEPKSEAFEAFLDVVTKGLIKECDKLSVTVDQHLLPQLSRLVDSMLAPLRLLEAMHTLEPLHYGLLNFDISKSRPPPQLLEASQSYVALRAQLFAELPQYLELLKKGIMMNILQLARWQSKFWGDVRDEWMGLWDALKVDGEMNAGATETLRVWWGRFAEVETMTSGLNIVRQLEKIQPSEMTRSRTKTWSRSLDDDASETSSTVIVSSILTSLDPFNLPPSSPSSQSLQTPVSGKSRSVRSMELGSRRALDHRGSAESLHSKKSGKSLKSSKSAGHNASQSVNYIPDEIGYGYETMLTSLDSSHTKPKYSRTKSMPISGALPLKKSYSQGRLLDTHYDDVVTSSSSRNVQNMHRPQPLSSLPFYDQLQEAVDRGRPTRKPSFRRRLTETLRPNTLSNSRHRRSPSLPATNTMGLSPSPSPNTSTFTNGSPTSSKRPSRRPSMGVKIPPMYICRVVHKCEPPPGVSYRDLPFFTLRVNDDYDVLQEAGHPSTHPDLPLYVDDGEDCLLLVRNYAGEIGWALASFLVPVD